MLNREQLRKALFVLALLAIAPFAIELIFVAEIVGAEVTVLFFLLFLRDQYRSLKDRWHEFVLEIAAVSAIATTHAVANPRYFYPHVIASFCLFFVTGSTFYLLALWYPVTILGGGLGVG